MTWNLGTGYVCWLLLEEGRALCWRCCVNIMKSSCVESQICLPVFLPTLTHLSVSFCLEVCGCRRAYPKAFSILALQESCCQLVRYVRAAHRPPALFAEDVAHGFPAESSQNPGRHREGEAGTGGVSGKLIWTERIWCEASWAGTREPQRYRGGNDEAGACWLMNDCWRDLRSVNTAANDTVLTCTGGLRLMCMYSDGIFVCSRNGWRLLTSGWASTVWTPSEMKFSMTPKFSSHITMLFLILPWVVGE